MAAVPGDGAGGTGETRGGERAVDTDGVTSKKDANVALAGKSPDEQMAQMARTAWNNNFHISD